MDEFKRTLRPPQISFFLFGPRGVGKSTWLKQSYPAALYIDLLKAETYLPLVNNPSRLEDYLTQNPKQRWVIIDEIQKIPPLLDEVHRLIEEKKINFALSGSSARKLKKSGANLLAGRALNKNLFTFNSLETPFPMREQLRWGNLPLLIKRKDIRRETLSSYVSMYLKEEIKEEGLVRKIEPFSRFLESAGLYNGQILNIENLARESHTPRNTVEKYFEILEDTLIARRLESIKLGFQKKEVVHPKFYFFDPGVARAAANLLTLDDPELLGRAFENLVYNELISFISYMNLDDKIFYYRSHDGLEVDFIIQVRPKTLSQKSQAVAIEVKMSERWDSRWSEPLLEIAQNSKVQIVKRYGIYLGESKSLSNGIELYNLKDFAQKIYKNKSFV